PFFHGYTASEFRDNPNLVAEASNLFNKTALGGHIMAVLINSIPSGYPMRGRNIDPTEASIELGRIQGYMDAIALIRLLCTHKDETNEPEVTYGAEDTKDKDPWETAPLTQEEP